VYAVGFSMGGGMSHHLACRAADTFAAVAPAAFDLLEENLADCEPTRPISVFAFRGTSDPIVPYEGGPSAVVSGMPVTFVGAKGSLEQWAKLNGCTDTPSTPDASNCSAHTKCEGGVEVMLCSKQGGGHEAGDASIAWPKLKAHALP
jgi:polyhydroxybutyrate depolymerase